jgi:DNA methylase
VLDLFGGSGSTLIAAEKLGRRARLMEIDPPYCDVIVRRWEEYTGKPAVLDSYGRTFEQVAAERAKEKKAPSIDQAARAERRLSLRRYWRSPSCSTFWRWPRRSSVQPLAVAHSISWFRVTIATPLIERVAPVSQGKFASYGQE